LKISREPPELLPIDGPVTIAVHQGEKHTHRRARKPMYNCSLFVYYKNSNRPLQGSTPVKSRSNSTTPSTVKGTVGRGRLPNAHYRVREYLTQKEVERLMKAAGDNRYGHRDATMILLAFRHGLRASELCSLRWEQIDLAHARLHVSRAKNGIPSVHPLTGTELRALRRLQREQEPARYVFMSERGAPMSAAGFRRMITRLGEAAKMPFSVHPHMLRHACGFKLANDGQDTRALQHYLGHKNIQHTVRYTELSPQRFRDFWKE
jgi:type 1 fimbriae regulatory protein FimB/type 1 fimbriae regulatory protein FimE